MKVLVAGAGSIGTRHIKNIKEMGHEVYAVDINPARLDTVGPLVKGTFKDLGTALKTGPDIAFICTFSNDHIRPAIMCAEAGCHIFIEKPLSLTYEGVETLVKAVRDNGSISMVGCNMRFHPAIARIYDTLKNNTAYSGPLWANIECGYYLPFAKGADYSKSYMARKELGGDLVFDMIHELDYAVWFFGRPLEVFCKKGTVSDLDINTQDHADMIIKFESGVVCPIHLDYLQHGYSRRCKVVCKGGTLVWDFSFGKEGLITAEGKEWSWEDRRFEIYYNQMFVDELEYFFGCVENGEKTFNTVERAADVLKLAIAANRSSFTNMWEKVD